MALIEQTISNHSSGLQRVLYVTGFTVNDVYKEVKFDYKIKHSLNDVEIDFKVPNKTWKISNSYNAVVRDENYEPVVNENYEPQYEIIGYEEVNVDEQDWENPKDPEPIYGDKVINEEEKYVTMPAYDYFKGLTFTNENPVSIHQLLSYYIQDNDTKGFFNFY